MKRFHTHRFIIGSFGIALMTRCLFFITLIWLLAGCASTRHVPEGEFLLDKVSIKVDSATGAENIDTEALQAYLRQTPNHRMLWSLRLRLGFYNMSGNDSTRFWNRWARKLGEPPVIFDSVLTDAGVDQLRKAMVNKGYLKAQVHADTVADAKKKKIKVTYRINPGEPYRIRSISYDIPDSSIHSLVTSRADRLPVSPGELLDRNIIDNERTIISDWLRNRGYYRLGKENITFSADTTEGSTEVDLTMRVSSSPNLNQTTPQGNIFDIWRIRKVFILTSFDPVRDTDLRNLQGIDTLTSHGIDILYGDHRYLRPGTLTENCFFSPGEIFRERDSDRTYQALSRLQILKFINIRILPAGDGTGLLDVYILLTPGKSMTAAFELEGTNSSGDLGIAAALTFTHRNIGRGSETFAAKIQGSYEALSGKLDDLLHNRYVEYGADLSLSFPKFVAPFLSDRFKRRVSASSALNISMNFQERPEYTRVISTAGWAYKWNRRDMRWRQTFTLVDVNYVYLPATTYDFLDRIAPDNPLLRYSYEDHFIMRMGYNFYLTNRRDQGPWQKSRQEAFFTLRGNIETAGNLLFALSNLFSHRHDFRKNPYSVFGIRYSQYVRLDGDFSWVRILDSRSSLALHAGAGIGIPYANSTILPFEKRFYGGGANGVRGWAVRTLGPGSYPGGNTVSDFINQCGDIRLELNAEYRAKLIWVLELGAFIDLGNIWTIRDYENQPGGVFRFNRFYQQIAGAYGLGLRMDFDYFLLRFDLGMKAFNPARGERRWPLVSPSWNRDASFHFSIGYPF